MEHKSIGDRISEIESGLESKASLEPDTRWSKAFRWIKRLTLPLVVAGVAAGYFYLDYKTKRWNYPVRYALIKTENKVDIAGNPEKRAAERADMESFNKFNEGGGGESKIGTQLAETKRVIRGDTQTFKIYDTQNIRIATSNLQTERFQAGMRFYGATSFSEQFAEIVLSSKSKAPQKYMVYEIDPEKGFKTNDIDVVEYPIERGLLENEPGTIVERDENGKKRKALEVLFNHLVESRNVLAWKYGRFYRDGTLLENFSRTEKNKQMSKEFFETVRTLDSEETKDNLELREKLVEKLKGVEANLDKKTVYSTFEDGFFKILPQGGEVYLGENPGFWKRAKHYWFGWTRNESNRLRIEWHMGLFPGNWPILNRIPFGTGKDKSYVFDKYNNGGYSIHDRFGELAKIEIQDFWFNFGQDVVYNYFLDLNGDGKIDTKTELIGKVLCTTTHDEKTEIQRLAHGIIPDHNMTLTTNYSFMAPDSDMKKAWEYFKLCAYVETMMPDQVHRGTGQHSLLGFINDQRSDIMLFRDLSIENMSRALTQESTLVAEHDIVSLLIATGRPYAEELAREYGIHDKFAGKYCVSPNLQERTDFGAFPWLMIYGGLGFGGIYGAKRGIRSYIDRRKQRRSEKSIGERLQEIRHEN